MRIDVITIFPDYLAPLRLSLPGRAVGSGLIDLRVHDLREWTHDRHRTVDDTPYGGGAGMVMKPEPWGEALDAVLGSGPADDTALIVPTPAGERFTQKIAHELSGVDHLVFACGRYEGIDQRVLDDAATRISVRELSLGDYVLNGGEVAAMAMIEATIRLLPGFMGNAESIVEESHAADTGGLLEYPSYTKPASWRGLDVPEVLLSGDHGRIAAWRHEQSVRRTATRRPDLLARSAALDDVDIRPAVPGDAGEILTLQLACWVSEQQDNPDAHVPALHEDLDDVRGWSGRGVVLVARSHGRLVGAARGLLDGDTWELGRLMVAPDLRGRGLGRILFERIEAAAPDSATGYALFTGAGSARNLRMYKKAGYRLLPGEVAPGTVRLVKRR
ncbi:MAG TPA: tRNA (guanosine(37)-N1)-methyltransferase TrmD [Marmoricola sp.]